jgi:hypothetical protein
VTLMLKVKSPMTPILYPTGRSCRFPTAFPTHPGDVGPVGNLLSPYGDLLFALTNGHLGTRSG